MHFSNLIIQKIIVDSCFIGLCSGCFLFVFYSLIVMFRKVKIFSNLFKIQKLYAVFAQLIVLLQAFLI